MAVLLIASVPVRAEDPKPAGDEDFTEEEREEFVVRDPLERINRPIFRFNDAFYRHVLSPIARGYERALPRRVRDSVGHFFHNLKTPVRLINLGLQAKFKAGGRELGRFFINTTAGVGGLFDPAGYLWDIRGQEEDLGQTLGKWGAGEGIFLQWPFLGPSTLRDSVGMLGDGLITPGYYLFPHDPWAKVGTNALEKVDAAPPAMEEYKSLRKGAIDPYTFFRDAYYQYRHKKVQE